VRFVQNVWQPGAPQPSGAMAEAEGDEAAETAARRMRPAAGGREDATGDAEADDAVAPAMRRLPREDVQNLQAALRELTECRRLLDAALREAP